MPYANNKDADQPAHPHSLISAFVVRCLDSNLPTVGLLSASGVHFANSENQYSAMSCVIVLET